MEAVVTSITDFFLRHELLDSDNVEWCQYIICKKISTWMTGGVALLLGTWVSSFPCAITFLVSFSFLLARTNGFHAQSFLGCFLISNIVEVAFLSFLPFMRTCVMLMLGFFSCVIIVVHAPGNNSHIHFNDKELQVVKKRVYIRLLALVGIALTVYFFQPVLAKCICLALLADAMSLSVAKFGVQ